VFLAGFRTLLLEKVHANLIPIHTDQFAAPVHAPGRRQDQEELFDLKSLNRFLDDQSCTSVGDVEQFTRASPGAIDSYDIDIVTALKRDAPGLAVTPRHDRHQGKQMYNFSLSPISVVLSFAKLAVRWMAAFSANPNSTLDERA
jgi:hypothetical protein